MHAGFLAHGSSSFTTRFGGRATGFILCCLSSAIGEIFYPRGVEWIGLAPDLGVAFYPNRGKVKESRPVIEAFGRIRTCEDPIAGLPLFEITRLYPSFTFTRMTPKSPAPDHGPYLIPNLREDMR